MVIVNFNPDKPLPEDIQKFYDESQAGIESKFDITQNPNYKADFAFLPPEEIEKQKKQLLDELSLRSSFFLLAYIESLFRTDFVLRLESNKKGYTDVLTKAYKNIYTPGHKPYTYSLTDVIFKEWRGYVVNKPNSKEMQDILRNLPQYFDFRNWMAHGRYWKYKESNYFNKYNYLQIQILNALIQKYFGPYLKKKSF